MKYRNNTSTNVFSNSTLDFNLRNNLNWKPSDYTVRVLYKTINKKSCIVFITNSKSLETAKIKVRLNYKEVQHKLNNLFTSHNQSVKELEEIRQRRIKRYENSILRHDNTNEPNY